jgi:hypothetical protein
LENLQAGRFSPEMSAALRSCYKNETKRLKNLKEEIKELQTKAFLKIKCQYCGVDTADTFDHYAPMSEFPEYSVLASNLIPACSKCNRFKGAVWRSGKKRNYVNLYFDRILHGRVLFCKATVGNGNKIKIEFLLRRGGTLSIQSFRMLQRHFKGLKLQQRYIGECSVEIEELKDNLADAGASSLISIKKELRRQMVRLRQQRGINFWKAAFYEGILGSPSAIKLLCL